MIRRLRGKSGFPIFTIVIYSLCRFYDLFVTQQRTTGKESCNEYGV